MASIYQEIAAHSGVSVHINPSPIFADSLNRFLDDKDKKRAQLIIKKLRTVINCKTAIPPTALPRGMKDHKLNPPPDCFECHLDQDTLLLYNLKNRRLHLLYVCTHDELYRSSVVKTVERHKLNCLSIYRAYSRFKATSLRFAFAASAD